MQQADALTALGSLSAAVRLDAFRLLVRQGPQGLVAGEMAAMLDLAPSNLSFHLKALTQAGLLTVEQEGRFQRYRAHMPMMRALIDYLTEECCAGQPELCADLRPVAPPPSEA
ncbi:MAG: helix-turn-helix transcriptional regulator [Pseudomonadota bacterium]|nr:helix-turn-helix transcriptional regulator [Pseudomonadota bacterium]